MRAILYLNRESCNRGLKNFQFELTHCTGRCAGGGLEDSPVGCGPKRSYYSMFETSGEDPGEEDLGDDCTQHVEKKRRLTFDQVRSLERTFEIENKLEPERKMQLSKELGLQPRQVAVWFQNRRARWKTKQLERDYEVLSSDFNRLKSEFEAVLQEKQELQGEVNLTLMLNPSPSNNRARSLIVEICPDYLKSARVVLLSSVSVHIRDNVPGEVTISSFRFL